MKPVSSTPYKWNVISNLEKAELQIFQIFKMNPT